MKKVLLIRLSSLGDLVIVSSVLELLKHRPYEIYLVTYKNFAPLFEHDPRIKEIITVPRPYKLKDILNVIKKIREQDFDFAFDLQFKVLSQVILKFSRAKFKYTYDNRRKERVRAVKSKIIPEEIPVYELYSRPIKETLELDDPTTCPVLYPYPIDLTLPEKYIVISPGAKHATKMWPYYGELVTVLKNLYREYEIVAIGDSKDSAVVEPYRNEVLDLTGKTRIPELLKVIERASLVVSNDSAAMHIASAYKVPTVAIFGPTIPEFGFRPCNAEIVEIKGLPCRPCSLHGSEKCPLSHFRCMKEINVDMVIKAIKKIFP